MITTSIINAIFSALTWIFSFLPSVTIASIPLVGPLLSSTLVTIVTSYNSAVETLPHLGVGLNVFILAILPFEALMLIGRFILGHRLPSHEVR